MSIFEEFIKANPDDPSGYHGWAESALFEIQENGNFDEKGNDRINEGQVAAYFKKAAALDQYRVPGSLRKRASSSTGSPWRSGNSGS